MSTTNLYLSVKAIIHDAEGSVLVLKRSGSSKGNAGRWEFPGGKIDPGEAFDSALLREIREETGLEVELTGSFGTCESDLGDRHIVYLVMEGKAGSTDVCLSSEHDEHKWLAPVDFGTIEFAPQFHRIALRYRADAEANPRVPKDDSAPQKRYSNW